MPGKSVKNWHVYHALRRDGMGKTKAAKIANSRGVGKSKGGKKGKR